MKLTIDNTDSNTETFKDCFDYLHETLQNYYLLTVSEREECVKAVERLKKVFSRFYEKKNAS